jgi:hypothetical protein
MREYVDPPDVGLIAQPFLKADLPCISNYSGQSNHYISHFKTETLSRIR